MDGKDFSEGGKKMAALTRKDNIPFIMKNCEKSKRVFYATPSKEEIKRIKTLALKFDQIDIRKQ